LLVKVSITNPFTGGPLPVFSLAGPAGEQPKGHQPMTLAEIKARLKAIAQRMAELASGDIDEAGSTEFADLTEERSKLQERFERLEEARTAAELSARVDASGPRAPERQAIPQPDGSNPRDAQPQQQTRIQRRFRVKPLKGFADEEAAYRSGMWFLGTILKNERAAQWCRENGAVAEERAQSTLSNTAGGALVIPEFERAIIDLRESYGVFRQKARFVSMASDTMTVPRRASGVTAYFVAENGEITESEKAWNQVSMTARKLAALTRYSSEIDEDSIVDMASDLASEIAYAFAVKEDQCGFLGTGTSTYGGISGLITECAAATATVVTSIAGNTAFSTLDLADFESMIGKLPSYPGIQPEWYIHKAGWAASMMRLQDAAGGNTAEVLEGQRRMTFLGYPVNFVQVINSILTAQASTAGLCYFGDLSMAATFGERRGIRIKTSDQRYFEYDQLGIQGTERVDINIHDVGDTSSAGAMIMLATPGA